MRLKVLFRLVIVVGLLQGCKGKQTEDSTQTSYIPLNTSESRVLDLAYLFSSTERDALIDKIHQYEEKTTNQIAILSIDSLPKSITIQRYGTEVANSWGIGTKEKNNGLLITISKFDRKVAISTGIGTEQTISDYDCKVVIDSVMIPEFKNTSYYTGVNESLDDLILLWIE